MSLTRVNGVTFHVQELGSGLPLWMLHGHGGSLASWYFTAAPALARTHRVLLYDLRGHGRSERVTTGYDLATMAADLAALAAFFDPRPLSLVGHSYGALVALRFTLDHPGRVARLALVEAPLPPASAGEIETFLGLDPLQMMTAMPETHQKALLRGRRRAGRILESLRFIWEQSTMLADLRREPDIADDRLAVIRQPVLLVYGRQSVCAQVPKRLLAVLPQARLTMLDGGHYLPIDAPRELTQSLAEFFDG